jgi:hypothetical protein
MLRRLSTVLAVLAAVSLFAAPAAGQGLDIGAEAGLNISDISADDVDTESVTGLRFGGVLRLDLGPMFGLQSGLYYSQKGTEAPVEDVTAEIDLDYFEVPLLLTLAIPTGPSPVTPRLYAGGQLAFESSCEVSATSGGVSFSADCDDPDADLADTESTDFSVVFGGGLDFEAGPGKVTVDARYDHGLTDIFVDATGDDTDEQNRNIALSAGYLISLP